MFVAEILGVSATSVKRIVMYFKLINFCSINKSIAKYWHWENPYNTHPYLLIKVISLHLYTAQERIDKATIFAKCSSAYYFIRAVMEDFFVWKMYLKH